MAFVVHTPFIERVFVIPQPGDIAVAPDVTGAKMIRTPESGVMIAPNIPITPVPWKTGTRSPQPGIQGRKSATWQLKNTPVIPSGSAGTAPDADTLFAALLGQAGTGGAYLLADGTPPLFALASFPHNQPGLTSMYAYGCIVTQADFTFNGNVFEMNMSGEGYYALDNRSFSLEPADAKGGLAGFPAEPTTPTTTGSIIPGYGATCTIDGQALEMRMVEMKMTFKTGFKLQMVYGSAHPQVVVAGMRETDATFGFINTDEATLTDLMQKAKFATPIDLSTTLGTNAGSQVKFDMKQLQLAMPELADTKEYVALNFKTSFAHATDIALTDEFAITFQ